MDIAPWGNMDRTDRRQEIRHHKRHCGFFDYGASMSLSGAETVAEAADIAACSKNLTGFRRDRREAFFLFHTGQFANVRVGSWLCKNALAEALMPGTRNAVSVCNDFPEYCGFSVWKCF
jgi:hypothetical protein